MLHAGLARGRALTACAIVAVALVGGGCATQASTSSMAGGTLDIYASAPAGSSRDRQDVVSAEELAFASFDGRIGHFKLKLVVLHGSPLSDNARAAIRDDNAIAYLGEVVPGQSADTVGIVGDEGLLQVSPTDTAVELTQGSSAVPGSPRIYIEAASTAPRTFARVVPTSASEARALISECRALRVTKLYVTNDGDHYGLALSSAVTRDADGPVTIARGAPTASGFASSGADALLYATPNPSTAAHLFDTVAASAPKTVLLGPSALDDQQFAAALSPAAKAALQISSPGFLPATLNAAGRQFVAAFTAAYHHAPATQAIFGYAAMAGVLDVLQEAGSGAATRATVVKDFFALRNRSSVLGTYSIDANGDTNIAPFVISRVRAGRLEPYKSVAG